jgi:hypothetical protein
MAKMNQFGVVEVNDPNQSSVYYAGKRYEIYDAYPSLSGARAYAEDLRTQPYPYDPRYRCRAVVGDLGLEAGRLRWAVFIAKGVRR